jgi:hypothetical protein
MSRSSEQWVPSRQPGDKFCTQCKDSCPAAGGMQIISEDKMHQRWICKRCKDRQDEKILQKTVRS